LMFQRRVVTLWAWLIRFPACGFLPQISHCCAMVTPITPDSRSFPGSDTKLYFTGQCSTPTIHPADSGRLSSRDRRPGFSTNANVHPSQRSTGRKCSNSQLARKAGLCNDGFMRNRVKHKGVAKRRSTDFNEMAHSLVDLSTRRLDNEHPESNSVPKSVSQYMAMIGRKGGQIGGKQRLQTMTADERRKVAQKAANARWAAQNELEP
jgi:hypothetical protein